MKDTFTALMVMLALAACGSTSGNPVEDPIENGDELPDAENPIEELPQAFDVDPASGTLGPANVALATAENGTVLLVTTDGTEIPFEVPEEEALQLATEIPLSNFVPVIAASETEQATAISFLRETDAARAGVGVVITDIFSLSEEDVLTIETGASFARLTDAAVPRTGSATFEGEYVALVLSPNEDFAGELVPEILLQGLVTLDADFAAGTIGGGITDRIVLLESDEDPNTIADVTFAMAAIDEAGAFNGVASGEDFLFDGLPVTTEDGTFSGLLAGAEATEAVGAVELTHTHDGGTFTEIGAFAAE